MDIKEIEEVLISLLLEFAKLREENTVLLNAAWAGLKALEAGKDGKEVGISLVKNMLKSIGKLDEGV